MAVKQYQPLIDGVVNKGHKELLEIFVAEAAEKAGEIVGKRADLLSSESETLLR